MPTRKVITITDGDLLEKLLHGSKGRYEWNEMMKRERALAAKTGSKLLIDLDYRDFSGIDMSGLDLRGASFLCGELQGTNLFQAQLKGVSFEGASFDSKTNFTSAELDRKTYFLDAYLHGCDLSQIKGELSPKQLAIVATMKEPPKLPKTMELREIFDAAWTISWKDPAGKSERVQEQIRAATNIADQQPTLV